MDERLSVDELFNKKLYRVPDYQRGYAWQQQHLKAFWEDIINLGPKRRHYMGVLTLKELPSGAIQETDREFWLIDDLSHRLYHVVDGQQRLTTIVVFLQALVDFMRVLHAGDNGSDHQLFISDSLSIADVCNQYLFQTKPTGDQYRTYKFGYTEDDPSHPYLRYEIFGEPGGTCAQETVYALNLGNAKRYFGEQLEELHETEGLEAIRDVYKRLTTRLMFNVYYISDEFDVFVAFETMNNRGKKLSDLELLKNRLIYLTTLYSESELDPAERQSLRVTINDAWREVYHHLGRNTTRPLNDDEYLRAHWIMYFKYSRQTGRDYIRFLLEERFSPKQVYQRTGRDVALQVPEELHTDDYREDDDVDDDLAEDGAAVPDADPDKLQPIEIRDFAHSLKESAKHWSDSFFPELAHDLGRDERAQLERLNRVGIGSFRPLVMSIQKNVADHDERISLLARIERFIFIVFRMMGSRSHYGSSAFYGAARDLDRRTLTGAELLSQLDERARFCFDSDGFVVVEFFHTLLRRLFDSGTGYYGWSGLRYFLYEYEESLRFESRQQKVEWSSLLKSERDRVSVEHIYPQSETDEWESRFATIPKDRRANYRNSLGNLLLLSSAVNSSLQNQPFAAKRIPKLDEAGRKLRNGFSDGSHSEIEVAQETEWGPEQIKDRGLRLLKFMERRWNLKFRDDDDKLKLLFLE